MMKTKKEVLIVDIAELIEAKQALIARMKRDRELLIKVDLSGVVVKINDDHDEHYLFDSSEIDEEILADALEDRMEWIIDNVYDRAISIAQDKIDHMLNQLKQDLFQEKLDDVFPLDTKFKEIEP